MLARAFAFAAVLLPAFGCILITPDEITSFDRCPLRGDSACGACLRTNCQVEIDSCCGTRDCRTGYASIATGDDESGSTMEALDKCAAGSATCTTDLSTARPSTAGTSVESCVTQKCGALCTDGSAQGIWTCTTPRTGFDCAGCIYGTCAPQLNACCQGGNGSACEARIQTAMKACTANDSAGCMRITEGDTGTLAGDLGACVERSCSSKCLDAKPLKCFRDSARTYCACENALIASGEECSIDAFPGTQCYKSDYGCRCGHYGCRRSNETDSCFCNLQNAGEATGDELRCNPTYLESLGVSGKVGCCFDEQSFLCSCATYNDECEGPSSRKVASCDPADVLPLLADRKTNRCSR